MLAHLFEQSDRVATRPHLALDGLGAVDDLGHAFFDFFEIVERERLVPGKIVIEAVVDRGADGDLRAGIKLLHRFGHGMCRVVPDEGERIVIPAFDQADSDAIRQFTIEIPDLAVHLHGDHDLGEPGADVRRQVRPGRPAVERTHAAVGELDLNGLGRRLGGRLRHGGIHRSSQGFSSPK